MLQPCPRCLRHIKAGGPCPFCNRFSHNKALLSTLAVGAAAVGAVILLSACYGPPTQDLGELDDPDAEAGDEHRHAADVRIDRGVVEASQD